MNKQIEELGKEIHSNCHCCLFEDEAESIAKFVIEEQGYRRQEDIAKEIIQVMDDSIEEPVSEYHKGYMDAIADWKRAIKKKYGVTEDEICI